MRKRGWMIAGGIVLLLIVAAVAGFFQLFEKVEEERIQPPAGEARTNPFLGLERFLEADGWTVETELTAANPNAADTLTIMAGDTSNYGTEQISLWESWVEDGGHLVISEPPAKLRRSDDMLETWGFGEPPELEDDSLGAAIKKAAEGAADDADDDEKDETEEDAEGAEKDAEGGEDHSESEDKSDAKSKATEAAEEGADEAENVELPMWGEPATVNEGTVVMRDVVADCPRTRLEADRVVLDRVWLGREDCMVAVSRPLGDGRVTIVPNLQMFSNARLGDFQHPTVAHDIFWQETGKAGEAATIVLYGKRISWIDYLWGLFWPTGISLLIILMFALLAGRTRFGPLVAPVETARRKRTEHVVAIGRFMWKHKAADTLLAATQDSLIHSVARGRVPTKLTRSEKAKWLADRTDISVEEASRVLAEHAPATPQHFADLIKQIEDLRRR